jgi:hypothetical protein
MAELSYVNAPLYVGHVYSDCLFKSICLAMHLHVVLTYVYAALGGTSAKGCVLCLGGGVGHQFLASLLLALYYYVCVLILLCMCPDTGI